MPNRILKESICTSATVDQLTAEEERLFYRLVVQCDDYGRFYAHPGIVRGHCFPRKPEVEVDQVARWLDALDRVDLVRIYDVSGDRYLQMITWGKHQQKRASNSKFPDPPPSVIESLRLLANDFIENQKSPYSYTGSVSDNRESIFDTRIPGGVVETADGSSVGLGDVARVYAHFKARVMPKSRTFPKEKIATRLKHFSVAELIQGIDNFSADSWWMENNGSRGAEWFFKSDSRSEQFLALVPRKTTVRGIQNGHTKTNGAISPAEAARYLGENVPADEPVTEDAGAAF